jgi:hypothetical protein
MNEAVGMGWKGIVVRESWWWLAIFLCVFPTCAVLALLAWPSFLALPALPCLPCLALPRLALLALCSEISL